MNQGDRGPSPGTHQSLKCVREPAAPALEELDERLERGFLPFGLDGPPDDPPSVPSWLEPCGCLGTLCACDGHDCAGVCGEHCFLNYV